MPIQLNRVGEKYITNQGYNVEIIEYRGVKDCDIQFESGLVLKNIRMDHLKLGKVINPLHPTFCGIGYLGEGIYTTYSEGKFHKSYTTWNSMLNRCYNNNRQKRDKTYVGCFVVKEWHNYQVFAKWFNENYTEGWQLDKDILVKNNKVYSPDTCCFVPPEINKIFVLKGKNKYSKEYKEIREIKIREVAEKFKDRLVVEVYQLLINYKI